MKYAQWCYLFFLSFYSFSCTATEINTSSCVSTTIKPFYAAYTIFDVLRYGGGLTTEAQAKATIGQHVSLQDKEFQFTHIVIKQPFYKIRCHPVLPEGEVETNRWSNFYGFGLNRSFIEVLEIYDQRYKDDKAYFYLEILDEQLWLLYDGWLYKMEELE